MPHATVRDPEYGTVCGCGRSKSKQAWKCQQCRNVEMRSPGWTLRSVGGNTLPEHERRRLVDEARNSITDPELARLVAQRASDDRKLTVGLRMHVSFDAVRDGLTLHDMVAA